MCPPTHRATPELGVPRRAMVCLEAEDAATLLHRIAQMVYFSYVTLLYSRNGHPADAYCRVLWYGAPHLKKANPSRGGGAKSRALMERTSRAAERMNHTGTQLT
jgi:hypothetical protein